MAAVALHKHSHPRRSPAFPEVVPPHGLSRVDFAAMGTVVTMLYPRQHIEAILAVREVFTHWEQTLSRFQPHSELSRLNRHTGLPVMVSPLLYEVLATALDAAQATGGLYDPTLLRQISALGYDRSFELLPQTVPSLPFPVGPGGGWRDIRLDAARRRVTLPPGVGLDLGGIAKGLAVDAALASLQDHAITPALVNAGGDLAVLGSPPAADAWPIAVPGTEHTWTLPLQRGAVATSGIARRRWRQGAHQRHHLLDPRTGTPAWSGLWSVTAVAATCAQAEVAAKVAFLLGAQAGASFLQAHGLLGLLVEEDRTVHMAGSWPAALAESAGEGRR